MERPQVALLGHGEAGRVLAAGLGPRVRLRVYDPAYPPGAQAKELVGSNAAAVRGADVVIAVTAGAGSLAACAESAPHLRPGALYADLSTAAPGDKREIAALVEAAGAVAVDGAIMAPVPLRGLATPILAAGAGAERFAAFARARGMDVTPIGLDPGDAAARKLLRSVLVKGLSALAIEARAAAEAAGLAEWFWEHLVETVTDADERFVRRLLEGAGQHGVRRVHEMDAATRMLEELDVPPTMTAATAATLRRATETGLPPLPRADRSREPGTISPDSTPGP
ncbi:DUF1932 domain-containing protein [Nonomuraea wenchangensis]